MTTAAARPPLAAVNLAHWTQNVTSRPVAPGDAHSIHSYFTACPESPDGKWVLYYHSRSADGSTGELRLRRRDNGEMRVLTRIHTVEDAHRVACQQWISGGRRVAFHDRRDGRWMVAVVDIENGTETVLARDRQIGSAQPLLDLVPIYGLHWDEKSKTDFRFLDGATGETVGVLSVADLTRRFAGELAQMPEFKGQIISLFFPVLSPDGKRIFFKLASPRGVGPDGIAMTAKAWFIGYDLAESRFLFRRDAWIHPSWHPDSRQIIQGDNRLIDSNDGTEKRIEGFPRFWGSHPVVSGDGQLFTTDFLPESVEGGAKGSRGILVGSMRGREYRVIHRFDDTRGATSWRRPHPHPAFSHDARRLYFNVSCSAWTQLYVAEAQDPPHRSEVPR